VAPLPEIPHEERMRLAADGQAMPDGSYPTPDDQPAYLEHAFQAYGRETEAQQPALRRYLVRRAVALGRCDLVPDDWHVTACDTKEPDERAN
jgi:hypothetical protein